MLCYALCLDQTKSECWFVEVVEAFQAVPGKAGISAFKMEGAMRDGPSHLNVHLAWPMMHCMIRSSTFA